VRARRNNRSLEEEIKIIWQDAAQEFTDDELDRKIKDSLRGYNHSDSAELLREDRMR
jgi:hypothetical protein